MCFCSLFWWARSGPGGVRSVGFCSSWCSGSFHADGTTQRRPDLFLWGCQRNQGPPIPTLQLPPSTGVRHNVLNRCVYCWDQHLQLVLLCLVGPAALQLPDSTDETLLVAPPFTSLSRFPSGMLSFLIFFLLVIYFFTWSKIIGSETCFVGFICDDSSRSFSRLRFLGSVRIRTPILRLLSQI